MTEYVYAYEPRKGDPPKYVADTYIDVQAKEGEYLGGAQCDGCGNHTYQIRVRMIAPGTRQYEAVCCNEEELDEFSHPDPCGAAYPIKRFDENEVEF